MDWSEPFLRRMYAASWPRYPWQRHAVGDFWPYAGGSDEDVDQYIQTLVSDLERSNLIAVETDFNSFGSGYASFVEVFCFKKDGSSRQRVLASGWRTTGILVYICRLAPVAIYGAEQRTRHAHGGSSDFLYFDTIETMPAGEWQAVRAEIQAKLESHGIEMATAQTLAQVLPFPARIETNLGQPPFRLFDLFFHWMD